MRDYIRIARLDHWFKNIFMLPGIALAFAFKPIYSTQLIPPIIMGIFSTCLIASANYVLNEWLDRDFDKHHPVKKQRPSVRIGLRAELVYTEYLLLAGSGLAIAWFVSRLFLLLSLTLLVMGLIYNVHPIRTKDKAYLDVLSESINNPLRLLLGWAILIPDILPPSSIWMAYWMGGAFIMAVKRYSEYRFINDPARAGQYRRSFSSYTEKSLFLSAFFYANLSSFFLAIFLIKYRIEYILSFPFFALLFVWYLSLGMRPDSAAKDPEKIFRDPRFLGLSVFIAALVVALFFVDIPILHVLVNKIQLPS